MKKKYFLLIALFINLLIGYILLENRKVTTYTEDYEIKLEASKLTARCLEEIKKFKIEKNIVIDKSIDINNTGLIGLDYSQITTTLGNIEAKRTSTNPNMSAAIVDMFNELGLHPKDNVAVNFSGSFPALNIATMCAIEKMELEPIIISSFGASTHGANDPNLTYLDMENYLYKIGLFSYRSTYFSIGGFHDIGKEMDPETRGIIIERLLNYGYKFIYDDNLLHNINTRYELYNKADDIKCFINVGGNDVSFGESSMMVYVNDCIITNFIEKDNATGLVQLFLKVNIPTIHILNIKSIATKYGLSVDPTPLPSVGEGGVYYTYEYNKVVAIIILIITSILMYIFHRTNKNKIT
ncbi:MAG: poly-gamma-glutamate system protein [Tissierellia bacterium]|nr:poly-gamma-glutamate system protein [Tissierellia bacterium]